MGSVMIFSGLPIELHPRRMRESDPYRPVSDEKLDVDSVGVPGRNGDDERLILAVQRFAGPAVDGLKVVIHNLKTIAEAPRRGNHEGGMWQVKAQTSSKWYTVLFGENFWWVAGETGRALTPEERRDGRKGSKPRKQTFQQVRP